MQALEEINAEDSYEPPAWVQLPAYQNGNAPSHHQYKRTRITTGDALNHIGESGHDDQDDNNNAFGFEIDNGYMEAAEAAEEEEPPEHFIPRPVKSRRIEQEMFGKVEDDSLECFGCEYLDDYNKKTTIPQDDVDHLRSISRECFGRMKTAILAKGMSDFYEKYIRSRINSNLQPGEDPLPAWPPAKVLEHLRYHHQDPTAKLVILLEETEEIREDLLGRCFETSTRNGRDRVNSKVINDYDKIVKLQLHIQSKDPTKMAFYSAGGRINPEALNQGILSTRTKKLHDYWK